jgi:hypothetical protein
MKLFIDSLEQHTDKPIVIEYSENTYCVVAVREGVVYVRSYKMRKEETIDIDILLSLLRFKFNQEIGCDSVVEIDPRMDGQDRVVFGSDRKDH